jgi:hypothetical protein
VEHELVETPFCIHFRVYFTMTLRICCVLAFLLVLVQSLTPDGASWIHPGRPFIATHTTPTRHVGKQRTRLQTDPYGMPSYGRLEDDAFVPVQDDPSKAVADFGKPGKSLFQELEERKRAAEAQAYSTRTPSARSSFQYTTSAAQASFQRRAPTMRGPGRSSGPRPDNTIHFHRHAAETGFRRPASSTSFDDERRKTAEASFGRSSSTSFNTQRASNAGFRNGPTGSSQRQQRRQQQRANAPPPPQDDFREFERHPYFRTREDWMGPIKARMQSPQEQEFYFAVQPTVGGANFGANMHEFFQQNPFEFFSSRSATSYRNRPLPPNFY